MNLQVDKNSKIVDNYINRNKIQSNINQVNYCVYYNYENNHILDFLPTNIDERFRSLIVRNWNEVIPREILIALSTKGEITASQLKEIIGHSSSTLHENIKKLEDDKLIETKMSYIGNKQRILKSKILFVSKSPKLKLKFQKFFQGLFVNSDKSKKILDYLNKNPKKYFTADEISVKINIPADEIHIHLSNWESQITRGLSDFLKKKPFEKKILYRSTR